MKTVCLAGWVVNLLQVVWEISKTFVDHHGQWEGFLVPQLFAINGIFIRRKSSTVKFPQIKLVLRLVKVNDNLHILLI